MSRRRAAPAKHNWLAPTLIAIAALLVVGALVVVLVLHASTQCSPVLPPQGKSILFPSRAGSAAVGVIISNSSDPKYDGVGFGVMPSHLKGAVYDASGVTTNGKAMLAHVGRADSGVGCVYMQMAIPSETDAWIQAAESLLKQDVAVSVLLGQTVDHDGTYAPFNAGAITQAVKVVQALQKKVGATLGAHVGIAMDIEHVSPLDGWAGLPALLPPRAATRQCGAINLTLFLGKNDIGKPETEAVLAAVDTVCVMFYRSMTKGNIRSGKNYKFASDMATTTTSGKTIAEAAAATGTTVLAGVETSWMEKDKPTKSQCTDILEDSFVLGGGMRPGTAPVEFFGEASTRAAYALAPAAAPTESFHFVVEELRPWLQLQANMAAPPTGWPAFSSSSGSANKTAGITACLGFTMPAHSK